MIGGEIYDPGTQVSRKDTTAFISTTWETECALFFSLLRPFPLVKLAASGRGHCRRTPQIAHSLS